MKLGLLLLLVLVSVFMPSYAQVKKLEAVKVVTAPHIDGSLDEEVWKTGTPATSFITNAPVFGKSSGLRTEVRLLYDDNAIYIGAYLFDNPSDIHSQLNERDQEQGADVDYFAVFLDTYKDKQNGFQFLVTSRNVQTDARLSSQIAVNPSVGQFGDLSWDAVWESKVTMKKDGWVVEMKIPYSAIRFSKAEIQNWGINFLRFARRNSETSFWNPIDPNENGFVNQFGDLTGLEHLSPPLRLSFLPYISTGTRRVPHEDGSYTNEWLKSGGMDIKYGLNESFTLDATLIPDFGQVISDNVVNNLSPYEIKFRENRPFFTEGTDLFNKAGIFYSRRVGHTPEKYDFVENFVDTSADYRIENNPSVTKLYNAIKFSGRNSKNLGIGFFNAITQPTEARLYNRQTGKDSIIATERLTNYNIIVLDQALKNRSSVTFTNTNVVRRGNEHNANVSALDLVFYDNKNQYKFALQPRYSTIYNSDSSDHNGFKNVTEIAKVSGKLQFSLMNNIESENYDPTDMGYLQAPNKITHTVNISYNLIQPVGPFLNQQYSFLANHTSLYKPYTYGQFMMKGQSLWLLQGLWNLNFVYEVTPRWYNDFFELQTKGRMLKKSPYYFVGTTGNSDPRRRLYFSWDMGFSETPLPDDPYYNLQLSARYRFGEHFSLEAIYDRSYDNGQFGYAFLREPNGDPILSRRKFTQVTTILQGTYNFSPSMNLVFRSRHYWNKIVNTNFYNVKEDGYWTERSFIADQNINYNTYNLDIFYTWYFKPGSRIIVGYKNWLSPTATFNGLAYPNYIDNFRKVMSDGGHGNELTLRFIYYLDYLQLKKKK